MVHCILRLLVPPTLARCYAALPFLFRPPLFSFTPKVVSSANPFDIFRPIRSSRKPILSSILLPVTRFLQSWHSLRPPPELPHPATPLKSPVFFFEPRIRDPVVRIQAAVIVKSHLPFLVLFTASIFRLFLLSFLSHFFDFTQSPSVACVNGLSKLTPLSTHWQLPGQLFKARFTPC